jgi:hypothetical protein
MQMDLTTSPAAATDAGPRGHEFAPDQRFVAGALGRGPGRAHHDREGETRAEFSAGILFPFLETRAIVPVYLKNGGQEWNRLA